MKSQLYKFLSWGGASKVLYTFALTLIFLLPTISARADGGDPIPYAVVENDTVKFYCDNNKPSENAFDLQEEYTMYSAPWKNVHVVVFDQSFKKYNPTSCANWFSGFPNQFIGFENLNTESVTDMSYMFANRFGFIPYLDLSTFNTNKVTNMEGMFTYCNIATIFVGEGWSTKSVTNSKDMFKYCYYLGGGKGTQYNENHTNASYAHIDGGETNPGYLSSYSAQAEASPYAMQVQSSLYFFYDNKKTENPNYYSFSHEKLDEQTVADAHNNGWHGMYGSIIAEMEPQAWSYNTMISNVVIDKSFKDYRPTSTNSWFLGLYYLSSIEGLENLNTEDVTDMSFMFFFNNEEEPHLFGNDNPNTPKSPLQSLDLSSFNTSKVTKMTDMFFDCSSLHEIYVGDGWNTDNVEDDDIYGVFSGCPYLYGGKGTLYDVANSSKEYARIDDPEHGKPGYFTRVGEDPWIPSSLTITTMPTKTVYEIGEYLDLQGGEVLATFPNGTTRSDALTNCFPSNTYFSQSGKQTITITYIGKSVTFDVTVKEKSPGEPSLVNGVYQITSAANLLWFANYVNSGNPNANAKLCADIVLNENLLSKIENGKTENLVTWIPIGTADNPYKGTFTTDTFAISGLYVNDSKQNYVGLFGYYAPENTQYVYYINVKDSYFAGHDYVGGLFGYVNSEKARLSYFYFRGEVSGNSNVGGLFGKIDVFENISRGYVSAKVTGSSNVGSVCGYLDGKTESNYFTNCYYDTQYSSMGAINGTDDVDNKIMGKNTFHTGEVAYLISFVQDLSDPLSYPELKGKVIHKNISGDGYHNPEYKEHHCKYCIHYTYTLPPCVDDVYQISTADELYGFMHLVNIGNNNIDAVLTADIVVNENVLEKVHSGNTEDLRVWYSIGATYNTFFDIAEKYYGNFDGQFHTISGLYFNNDISFGTAQSGFFDDIYYSVKNVILKDTYFRSPENNIGGIANCMEDTKLKSVNNVNYSDGYTEPIIENCIFDGEIIGNEVGGICCGTVGSTRNIMKIQNCINFAKIKCGMYSAGILAASWSGGCSVINCYNAGEIVCAEQDGYCVGGISGGASLYGISNCYNTGKVTNGYGIYGTHWTPVNITNAYNNRDVCSDYMYDSNGDNITGGGNTTTATLCNGTLPEGFSSDDWIPGKTETKDGKIVYTFPHLKVFEGKYPAYSITKDEQSFTEPTLVNGYYQITTAQELLWFSNYVNSGNTDAKAALYADIVLNENLLSKIKNGETENLVTWIPIGTADNPFKGELKNADKFTISGLYVNNPNQDYVGLFGYCVSVGYLDNIYGVIDSYLAGHNYVGGIYGYYDYGESSISGSYFRGTLSGNNYVGGIVGYATNSIYDCYVVGSISGTTNAGAIAGVIDSDNVSGDCYYDNSITTLTAFGNGQDDEENNVKGTTTMFHTGAVAYACDFRQDLSDPNSLPEFKGQHIHLNIDDSGYHNPEYEEGHCKYCINYTYSLPQLVDGVYQISTADELYGFMHIVNTGNNYANAVLTADIVVNENVLEKVHSGNTESLREWYSIGEGHVEYGGNYEQDNPYYGVFDGKFHTISGLYFDSKISGEDQGGLFAYVLGTVKNVIVKDAYFKAETGRIGGISLYLGARSIDDHTKNPVIENCAFDGEIFGRSGAGICGCILNCSSTVIKNCINLGKISVLGINSYSGGILGVYFGGGVNAMVINCYNAGEIIVRPESDVPLETTQISVGGICGGTMINSISNCYNTGKVTTGYGIYGTHWGACTISDVYNNSDICNLPIVFDEWGGNTITGGGNTTTATLCNGTLPEGFSSDDWIPGKTETKDGKIVYTFPHLKVFDGKYPAYSIEEKLPVAIEIKTPPTQTEYALGEDLSKDGLVVTFTYSDHTTIDVDYYGSYDQTSTEYRLKNSLMDSDFDSDNTTTGKKTVTVRYQDLSAQFEVNVVDRGVCGYQYLDEDGTLTFYYGEYKNGAGYIGPNGCSRPFDGAQVKKAVFDPSFKDFKPTNLTNMLCFVPNLQEIVDMDKYLNTEDVVDMQWMFAYFPLTTLDLSTFDTRKVKNMTCMFADFSGQTNFTTIYVGDKWSTESLEPCMMFFNCTNLVGGKGTKCNETTWDNNDYIYARIDDPEHGKPGYFTYKGPNPYTEPEVVDNVYQISSASELLYFMFDVNSGNVSANAVLLNDIVVNADLLKQIAELLKSTSKAAPVLTTWQPIGTTKNAYRGTFDGNGHTISGIYIKDETQNNVGLFGNVAPEAVIKNLGVTDSYIAGNENVGAICGKSEGTVVNCYTVSEVKGNKNVNALVGAKETAAVVENCYYLAETPVANDPCAKTAEEFKSGDVAKLLAKGATINGVTYSGETFANTTVLPGTENIEVISDPENPPTPVSEISPNINVNVWSYNHIIYIENAPDAEYRIIDLNGRLITTSTTKSTKEEIQINKSGILIVIIGNQSFKVSL